MTKKLYKIKKCPSCSKEFISNHKNWKYCLECSKSRREVYLKEYQIKNKEKIKALAKEWVKNNLEKVREKRLRHRQTQKCKETTQRYNRRPDVRAKRRITIKKWRNSPHGKEWRKEYQARPEVHEKRMARSRAYKHTDIGLAKARYYNERRRERKAGTVAGYTQEQFLEKVKATNGRCPFCSQLFSSTYHSKNELTVDHIMPISEAPKGFVYTIDMINPICRSCNAKKGNRDSIIWMILSGKKK